MQWFFILLPIWLSGWLTTIGMGVWRDVRFARLDQQPPYLRAWLYRGIPALVTWPLYLILVTRDLYLLRRFEEKFRDK